MSNPNWDIEKGKIHKISPMKRIPPDHVSQKKKDMMRALRPVSPKKAAAVFNQLPPEKREHKEMANEDLESYVHELNKPMPSFLRKGGRKSRRNHKKSQHRRKSRKSTTAKK